MLGVPDLSLNGERRIRALPPRRRFNRNHLVGLLPRLRRRRALARLDQDRHQDRGDQQSEKDRAGHRYLGISH
jgi:hypothetical protein